MNTQTINLGSMMSSLDGLSLEGPAAGGMGGQPETKAFFGLLQKALQSEQSNRAEGSGSGGKQKNSDENWLDRLQSLLSAAGVPLKNLSLSREAIPELRKLLANEGIPEKEIKRFLKGLFGDGATERISISTLLEKVADLKFSSRCSQDDPVVEAALVPYVENLLSLLGLDANQAERAVTQARIESPSKGVSLKRLAQQLKAIERESGRAAPDTTRRDVSDDIKNAMGRIGLGEQAKTMSGPITLGQFVEALEDKLASLKSQSLSEDEVKVHVDRLLHKVTLDAQEQGESLKSKTRYSGEIDPFSAGEKAVSTTALKLAEGFSSNRRGPQGRGVDQYGKRGVEATTGREGLGTNGEALGKAGAVSVDGESAEAIEGREVFSGEKVKELLAGDGLPGRNKGRVQPEAKTGEGLAGSGDTVNRTAGDLGGEAGSFSVKGPLAERPAAGAEAAREMPRPLPLHVLNQVARQMALSFQRGDRQIHLQLNPPHLGSLQLDMDMQSNVVKVSIVTEHYSVRELLMSHVQELREILGGQGVELARVDVQVDYQFGQSMADAQRHLHDSASERKGFAGGIGGPRGEDGDEEAPASVKRQNDGLLDMFA